MPPPEGFDSEGLWPRDPNGMCLRLVEGEPDPPLPREPVFAINSPGHIVRTRRSAILPKKAYGLVSQLSSNSRMASRLIMASSIFSIPGS